MKKRSIAVSYPLVTLGLGVLFSQCLRWPRVFHFLDETLRVMIRCPPLPRSGLVGALISPCHFARDQTSAWEAFVGLKLLY